MDFHYSPEDQAFRLELRTWLEANAPKDEAHTNDPFMEDSLEGWQRRLEWHRKMHAAGWVGISWPKEYGGREATLTQSLIYEEEVSRARAPRLLNGLGIALVGPTLMHWGTEEQKKRYIPKILSAEEIWCQGYSEPGSGSDVASLRTSAVEDGDSFVVNGQKVWTSDAHHADMYTRYRQITRRLQGLPPGPEGSVLKLAMSELSMKMSYFAAAMLGPYSQIAFKAPAAIDRGKWAYRALAARALTIAGGTSEIQRNIIGERVLGLPKG